MQNVTFIAAPEGTGWAVKVVLTGATVVPIKPGGPAVTDFVAIQSRGRDQPWTQARPVAGQRPEWFRSLGLLARVDSVPAEPPSAREDTMVRWADQPARERAR
jgi:hypothetical protein